ncbi:MAG TPA: cupin domain-containing protein [Anaerolineaceae bacterium]|jgi:mannose-6-phosphate isomerase-like protein (cupin superfamily)
MQLEPIDINHKFSLFTEHWSPKVIGRINNYLVKIGKLQGDFVWHQHDETDELFIVNKGILRVDLRQGPVFLSAGQMLIVPKGVEHRTHADEECELIMFEPETTLYTGNVQGDPSEPVLAWI